MVRVYRATAAVAGLDCPLVQGYRTRRLLLFITTINQCFVYCLKVLQSPSLD